MVFNALSVIAGFVTLLFSEFLPVYFFGWLITISISMCLAGSFTLLPAVVKTVKPGFIYKTKT
ncbi:MAG: hypothetical protein ACLFQK_10725 [Fibrobacterota bacterium]